MYRALVSFSGKLAMSKGKVMEIKDKELVKSLLNAGYIEEVKTKAETKPTKKKEK